MGNYNYPLSKKGLTRLTRYSCSVQIRAESRQNIKRIRLQRVTFYYVLNIKY